VIYYSKKYDFVVIGGGLAGCSAAISAARQGAKVALVNNRPVLGGNTSKEIRVPALGAMCGENNCYARETGLVEELNLENLYKNPEGNAEYWDMILLEKVLAEKNLDLYQNTNITSVKVKNNYIQDVSGYTLGSETYFNFKGKFFADCTGDGTVGYLASAPFRIGRESKKEFNESLTPSKHLPYVLGSTIMLRAKDIGKPVFFTPPLGAYKFQKGDFRIGRNPEILFRPDNEFVWWVEYGGHIDTVHDNEKIKYELLKIIWGLWDYLKNNPKLKKKHENLTIEWIGNIPGKRESRRFEGDYILTESDIRNQTDFFDAIAYGGWSMDHHPEKGFFASTPGTVMHHTPGIYNIPYRCLYSKKIKNLFFAGRDISVSHVALTTTRLILTCAQTGEAVGVAAEMCLKKKCLPRDLTKKNEIKKLQNVLVKNDHYIRGFKIEDKMNIACKAKISASSFLNSINITKADNLLSLNISRLLMFPVNTGYIDSIEILLDVERTTNIVYCLYSGDNKGNYFPAKKLYQNSISVRKIKKSWVELPIKLSVQKNRWYFLQLKANQNVQIYTSYNKLVGINSFAYSGKKLSKKIERLYSCERHNIYSNWERLNGIWSTKHENYCFKINPARTVYNCENIANGYTRPYNLPNIWISGVADFKKPEWIFFEWEKPHVIREIRLYFNTDLDYAIRNLGMSFPFKVMSDCVRDYSITTKVSKRTEVLIDIRDNYQRMRVHNISSIKTDNLSINIKSTNGSPMAQIYEVGIY